MATFKIRDLMVAVRPGLQTPQRPAALDDCGDDEPTIVCEVAPLDSGGGCDDCTNTVDCECSGTPVGCGPTCAPCTDGCTGTCAACTRTCGCTQTCGCTRTACGACSVAVSCKASRCAGVSIRPPVIEQMGAGDLANLKAQLRLMIQRVSQRENVLGAAAEAKAIVPQTLEQVDALEQKFSEAMEELRARRAEIQKTAAQTGTKSTDQK